MKDLTILSGCWGHTFSRSVYPPNDVLETGRNNSSQFARLKLPIAYSYARWKWICILSAFKIFWNGKYSFLTLEMYLSSFAICCYFVHPLYKFLILYTYLIPVDDKGAVKMLKEPFTNHHWNSHYTLDHKARKGVIESIR